MRAAAPGYQPRERTVEVPSDGSVQIELTLAPQPVALDPIEVRAASEGAAAVAAPGPVRIDAATVESIPALAETDVLRTLQALPSVQAASNFSSALYFRGGSPDQNLILLDGAPLFNPFHLGGVFAAIDPDAIASLSVFPGSFPARLLLTAYDTACARYVAQVIGRGSVLQGRASAGVEGSLGVFAEAASAERRAVFVPAR